MKLITIISLLLVSIKSEEENHQMPCNYEMEAQCLGVTHQTINSCGGDPNCRCQASQELFQCYQICPSNHSGDFEEVQMEIENYCSFGMGPGPGIPVLPGPPIIAGSQPSVPPGVAMPPPPMPSLPAGAQPTIQPANPAISSWANKPIPTNVAAPTPSGAPPTMVPPPPLSPNNQSQNNGQIQGSWTYATGYGNHSNQNPNMSNAFTSKRNSANREKISVISVALIVSIGMLLN